MYSTRRASDKKLEASVEKGCHGERLVPCGDFAFLSLRV